MDWFDLLKQPKLRAGSKVTTNLGIDGEKDDGPCKRKIQEYMDKANRMDQDGYYRAGKLKTSTTVPDWPEEVYCMALKKLNEFSFEKLSKESLSHGGYDWWQDIHADLGDYIVNGYYGGRYEMIGEEDGHYVFMSLIITKTIPDEEVFIRHFGDVKGKDISIFHEAVKEIDWR
jgi:hypothetical protein